MKRVLSLKEEVEFNKLLKRAKRCESDDQLHRALALYKKCAAIRRGDPKLEKKIFTLKDKIKDPTVPVMDFSDDEDVDDDSDSDSDSDDDSDNGNGDTKLSLSKIFSGVNFCETSRKFSGSSLISSQTAGSTTDKSQISIFGSTNSDVRIGGLCIPPDIYGKLRDYQKAGVQWLWSVHNMDPHGGMLCDDMGLGKTIQMSVFLCGLIRGMVINRALIVVPLSVMNQWIKELSEWAPGVPVNVYHSNYSLKDPTAYNGVCLTTYGMVLHHIKELSPGGFTWDYVILDEGHIIKNSRAKTSKCVNDLSSERRLIMTGTPVTNNLQEFRNLITWVCQTKLLGTKDAFHIEIEGKIISGSDKMAEDIDKGLGDKIAEYFREMFAPHILRREKGDLPKEESTPPTNGGNIFVPRTPGKISVRKNDIAVWIKLTGVQVELYKKFVNSNEVDKLMESNRCSFAAIDVLKKICNHPFLLKRRTKTTRNLDLSLLDTHNDLVQVSAKMPILLSILYRLTKNGHKMLVFSRSTKMLGIIGKCLKMSKINFVRIDGSCSSKTRNGVISDFTANELISCLLLTTQVGAVGLNLVAADRVIIFDPSWNNTDDQAVDRVYRIGQKRDVIIYRLFTCGTVDEKIYRKQITKQYLMRTTTKNDSNYRYFSKQELSELLKFESSDFSETQKMLSETHKGQRKSYPELEDDIKFIKSLGNVVDVSDHDLLFTKSENVHVEDTDVIDKLASNAVNAVKKSENLKENDDYNDDDGIVNKNETEKSDCDSTDEEKELKDEYDYDPCRDESISLDYDSDDDDIDPYAFHGSNKRNQRNFISSPDSIGEIPLATKRGVASIYKSDEKAILDFSEPKKKASKHSYSKNDGVSITPPSKSKRRDSGFMSSPIRTETMSIDKVIVSETPSVKNPLQVQPRRKSYPYLMKVNEVTSLSNDNVVSSNSNVERSYQKSTRKISENGSDLDNKETDDILISKLKAAGASFKSKIARSASAQSSPSFGIIKDKVRPTYGMNGVNNSPSILSAASLSAGAPTGKQNPSYNSNNYANDIRSDTNTQFGTASPLGMKVGWPKPSCGVNIGNGNEIHLDAHIKVNDLSLGAKKKDGKSIYGTNGNNTNIPSFPTSSSNSSSGAATGISKPSYGAKNDSNSSSISSSLSNQSVRAATNVSKPSYWINSYSNTSSIPTSSSSPSSGLIGNGSKSSCNTNDRGNILSRPSTQLNSIPPALSYDPIKNVQNTAYNNPSSYSSLRTASGLRSTNGISDNNSSPATTTMQPISLRSAYNTAKASPGPISQTSYDTSKTSSQFNSPGLSHQTNYSATETAIQSGSVKEASKRYNSNSAYHTSSSSLRSTTRSTSSGLIHRETKNVPGTPSQPSSLSSTNRTMMNNLSSTTQTSNSSSVISPRSTLLDSAPQANSGASSNSSKNNSGTDQGKSTKSMSNIDCAMIWKIILTIGITIFCFAYFLFCLFIIIIFLF